MTAHETRTCMGSRALRRTRMAMPASAAPTSRSSLAALVAAHAFGFLVVALSSYAQTDPPGYVVARRGASQVTEATPQIAAGTLSCTELKSRIRDSGTLVIASGPTGGDIFHARVPECEFWQRPQFSYVTAKDGWCGVGYICTGKVQGR